MDEQPFEPAVMAVEQYRAEDHHRKKTFGLFFGAFACALLGAGAVIAVIKFNPELMGKAPAVVIREPIKEPALPPAIKPDVKANSLYTPDTPPEKGKEPTTEPNSNPNPLPQGPISPMNPFAGALISTQGVPRDWKPGDPPPGTGPIGTKPDSQNPEGNKPAEQTKEGTLVTGRSSSGDAEAEGEAIIRALQGAGASVRSAPHSSLGGSIVGMQIVATVPAASLDSAVARIKSAGVRVSDRWSGPPGQRSGMVADMIAGRISQLKRTEAELREKYEDDAGEVVAVREEIQKLNQCMGASGSAVKSAGIAIIVIGIGVL